MPRRLEVFEFFRLSLIRGRCFRFHPQKFRKSEGQYYQNIKFSNKNNFNFNTLMTVCKNEEFLGLEETEFNQIIISEWLNADDSQIKDATDAWHKHR